MIYAILIYAPVTLAQESGATTDAEAKTTESVSEDAAKAPVTLPGNANKKKPAKVKAPAPGEIKPLEGGKTIAEIYTDSAQLSGQVVSLRAKVTKVNRNMMGKNWITLHDGTKTEKGTKLVATTQELVAVGDVVIAKGTISTDVDLGRGYFYAVMMEEASFSSEAK